MSLSASGPNSEQIRYWNEQSGPKWVRLETRLDEQIAPLGLAAMQTGGIGAGAKVLDVGCGCGQTSLQLAERVGESGSVLGADISGPMLERAAARAKAAPAANVSFVHADAQTHTFPQGAFDAVFSRFGVMFFADPVAAFANLRRGIADSGGLAFVCWQPLSENPWMSEPMAAIAGLVDLSNTPRPAPGAPGPFSMGDPDRVRAILGDAGYTSIDVDPLRTEVSLGGGGTLDEIVDFALEMGPASAALKASGQDVTQEIRDAVRDALSPHTTGKGVSMDAAAWVVAARAR